jgi:hypothetical protein
LKQFWTNHHHHNNDDCTRRKFKNKITHLICSYLF